MEEIRSHIQRREGSRVCRVPDAERTGWKGTALSEVQGKEGLAEVARERMPHTLSLSLFFSLPLPLSLSPEPFL